jgi:quercetin dioxygenase-like cupin family protein
LHLFEAYNIGAGLHWKGDLLAFACLIQRQEPSFRAAAIRKISVRGRRIRFLARRSGRWAAACANELDTKNHRDRGDGDMAALEKGITANGTGYGGKTWNILGQVYFPKAVTDSTFAFETNSEPGQFVPMHVHPTQDEFILVQEGTLDLKLDGVWVQAKAGDLVRMPRGIPHGYFNKSDKPARALFWVSPMQKLEALFNQLHNLTDPEEVVRISAQHEVNFLPPEANE